jgi:hypothetical protein
MIPSDQSGTIDQNSGTVCICKSSLLHCIDQDIGHIRTSDITILKELGISPHTIHLLSMGPKHRPVPTYEQIKKDISLCFGSMDTVMAALISSLPLDPESKAALISKAKHRHRHKHSSTHRAETHRQQDTGHRQAQRHSRHTHKVATRHTAAEQ